MFTRLTNLLDQKYERYLPTAFDESFTILEKLNKLIDFLNSIIDLANGQSEEIESLRDEFVALRERVEGEGLINATTDILQLWYENGKLSDIINQQVFTDIHNQFKDIGLNVRFYGAVGDGVTDDTQAFKDAIADALLYGYPVYVPNGNYIVSDTLLVKYTIGQSQGSTFKLYGNDSGTAIQAKTKIIFTKANSILFDVQVNEYPSESYVFDGFSMFQKEGSPEYNTSVGIQFSKNTSNYSRKFHIDNVNSNGLKTLVKFLGLSATRNNNYFGPTHLGKIHTYLTKTFMEVDNCVLNLLTTKQGLFHGCLDYAVKMVNTGAIYAKYEDVHFEGCEPSAFRTEPNHTKLSFDGVSSENTGDVSGLGLISGSSNHSLELHVSNQVYPFVLMPDEFRLPIGTTVYATCPIKVSGEGIRIMTPEMVTPVVSNNTAYNQNDKYTFVLAEPNFIGSHFAGQKVFEYAYHGKTPDSNTLPDGLKNTYLGLGAGTMITNIAKTFTAPTDGFLYFTWMSKRDDDLNGIEQADILIDGVAVPIQIGYRIKRWEGFYTLVVPIKQLQILSNVIIRQYTPAYQTPVMVSFSPTVKKASLACNGYPRRVRERKTIASGATLRINPASAEGKNYAIKTTLLFNNGGLGVYEFTVRGTGANTGRMETINMNNLDASITVTNVASPAHFEFFSKDIANTSGSTVNVDIIMEYLN